METSLDSSKFAQYLQKIMESHELSATAFAEKLAVGRATISHLMSGRNKPSLDFVMKVVSTFPEVDINELLFGIKNPTTLSDTRAVNLAKFNSQKKTSYENREISQQGFRESKNNYQEKAVDRIVIFYNDGTFTTHTPDETQ